MEKSSHSDDSAREENDRARREEHNHRQGILRLPPELRYQIYHLLAPKQTARIIRLLKQTHFSLCSDYLPGQDRKHDACLPALLSTCRQLWAEFSPLFWSKAVPSLELREMLEPWVRGRFAANRRLPFPFVFGEETMGCLERIELRCQWRCLDCREQRSIRSLPQSTNFVMDDEGMKYVPALWESPTQNHTFSSLHTIDCVVVEVERRVRGGGVSIKNLAKVRGEENLRKCCRATAEKVAEKLVLEIANMKLQDRDHELSRLDFEMLARRMRWHAWGRRWFYRLSKHSFILAWHDIKSNKKGLPKYDKATNPEHGATHISI